MIATIANELVQNGTYECYIKVVNEDNNIYWLQKAVPVEEATPENKEAWKDLAIEQAEVYFVGNYQEMPEVIE